MAYKNSRGIRKQSAGSKIINGTRARHEKRVLNYFADGDRSLDSLMMLLCESGLRSRGDSCRGCESECRFGKEFIKRKDGL